MQPAARRKPVCQREHGPQRTAGLGRTAGDLSAGMPRMTRIGKLDTDQSETELAKLKRDAAFVSDTGLVEDNEVVTRIQQGLHTNANTHFTYGLYEKAIVHMHENLTRMIGLLE